MYKYVRLKWANSISGRECNTKKRLPVHKIEMEMPNIDIFYHVYFFLQQV